jgi:hypothetical protein
MKGSQAPPTPLEAFISDPSGKSIFQILQPG